MQIGDRIEAETPAEARGLYIPGPRRWHALIVPPQRETAAEAWLKVRGIYAFHPVKRRFTTIRGKRVERHQRYLPGYVFANVPGQMVWYRLFASPLISDAIRMHSGEPGILRADDLRMIQAMRPRDEAADAAKAARAAGAKLFAPGDAVEITKGPLAGTRSEVVEIRAGSAILRLTMFGSEREAEVDFQIMREG